MSVPESKLRSTGNDDFNADLTFDRKVILRMGELFSLGINVDEESASPLCIFLSPTYLQLAHDSTNWPKWAKAGKVDSFVDSRGWENLQNHSGVVDTLTSRAGKETESQRNFWKAEGSGWMVSYAWTTRFWEGNGW